MPEKKVHEPCGKTVAHKLNGEPYTHVCDARPDDPFETAGQAKPEPECVLENVPHSFTWNPHANESQCVGCGEPDTAAAKAARTHEDLSIRNNVTGQIFSAAEPDPWDDPSPTAGPKLNVSGQPDARYEWRGKQNYGYLVKDPRTGDFLRYKNGKTKGWTRATTFNKAASDSNALSDWGKRNVLIGASKRPDVVARAHGLTHETGKGELMSLVAELETAAGAKVSAQQGTDIHELTERWDGGQMAIEDIPPMYIETLRLYQHALNQAGLRAVPGLIERTVFVEDFGGIVGTFDRVYLHEASGQYVIGDVKTGKTLAYGMDEIETQEWIYAAGINRHGVYDWNTDEWGDPPPDDNCKWDLPIKVSEEWGVVVHLPVQGPDAGTCKLVRADLQRGKRHAQVCHDVRVDRANKPKPESWTGAELKAPECAGRPVTVEWRGAFSRVTNRADAFALWEEATAAGVGPAELDLLVEMAQQRLRELGV